MKKTPKKKKAKRSGVTDTARKAAKVHAQAAKLAAPVTRDEFNEALKTVVRYTRESKRGIITIPGKVAGRTVHVVAIATGKAETFALEAALTDVNRVLDERMGLI